MRFLGKGAILVLILAFSFGSPAHANQAPASTAKAPEAKAAAAKAGEAKAPEQKSWLPGCTQPPLPLFWIEGYDGVPLNYSAYLMNPCKKPGQVFSYPNIGAGFLIFPSGRWMTYAAISETLWDRVGISYGTEIPGIDSLREDIQNTTGLNIQSSSIRMHNINGRLVLLKEGEFGQKWLPQVTFGAHWKYNEDLKGINDNLKVPGAFNGGVIRDVCGITHDSG